MGTLELRKHVGLDSTGFIDPLENRRTMTDKYGLETYIPLLEPHIGAIEYVDPYEQNESFIANNPAYITPETTHIEVHPSTIMSMMTCMIPFAQHNQSPRNQLSCSQSKQGISIYATNWRNRFDNTAHVLCYGEMPITRTIYNNYLGEGKMAYGMNCILAIACWSGYNQEDGIVMNYDAIQRGMFRSMAFRSYEAFEEDDQKANSILRVGNPIHIHTWKKLKLGLDYSNYDEKFYEIIDRMFSLHFGKEAAEIIFFYIYERMNPDGTVNELLDQNNEIIPINSPSDLWYLVNHIKNKTKKVVKK